MGRVSLFFYFILRRSHIIYGNFSQALCTSTECQFSIASVSNQNNGSQLQWFESCLKIVFFMGYIKGRCK